MCNDLVVGSNVGEPSNVSYYSCVGWLESGGEVVYELVLPGPGEKILFVSLDTQGCDLDLFLLGSCDENDCITHGDVGLVAAPLSAGTYYLVVDGYEGDACPFTLTVTCGDLDEPCCPLLDDCVFYDFNDSDHGFWTVPCGGEPVWDWLPVPQGGRQTCDALSAQNLLGTGSLIDDYPNNAGEMAVIGPVMITEDCWCMEICHITYIEFEWDGGNVKVSDDQGATWDLVHPTRGYDWVATPWTTCVTGEPVFCEEASPWLLDCFNLSAYVGSEILIGFFFGSDESYTYPGWFIRWVKIGSGENPVEATSWGMIKMLYR
jgi:hypothetical protein